MGKLSCLQRLNGEWADRTAMLIGWAVLNGGLGRMQDAGSPWLLQIEEVGVGSLPQVGERMVRGSWFLKCSAHMVS